MWFTLLNIGNRLSNPSPDLSSAHSDNSGQCQQVPLCQHLGNQESIIQYEQERRDFKTLCFIFHYLNSECIVHSYNG